MALKYLTFILFLAFARTTMACATCSGPADAPQSQGMNAAILTLVAMLAAVGLVFLGFGWAVMRHAMRYNRSEPEESPPETIAGVFVEP